MKKTFLIVIAIVSISIAKAQVAKNMIVEHFTNTKCSICASRNPGLNTNLNANTQVQRISIHPSSPYSNCFLSQQNTAQNDARTNYYGVFGGTPKLVINGSPISTSQNYADAAMFAPFVAQSNFSIGIKQYAVGLDSIRSELVIKRVAPGAPTGSASLFAGLVEDTVFGNGGNGEAEHYNVLRRALFTPQGQVVTLPVNTGDSLILNQTEKFNSVWNSTRMRTVAILQDEITKLVIQSELSTTEQIGATTMIKNYNNLSSLNVYPNPASQYIAVGSSDFKLYNFELSNQLGQVIAKGFVSNKQRINVADFNNGIYFLKIFDERAELTRKILIKH
jgi:hypothetical protein